MLLTACYTVSCIHLVIVANPFYNIINLAMFVRQNILHTSIHQLRLDLLVLLYPHAHF